MRGQVEGLGGEVRHRRSVGHADLDKALDTETTALYGCKEQFLGLDPSDRARELPGQQLHQQQASQSRGRGDPGVPVRQDLGQGLGGHQVGDLLHEVAVEAEHARHEVRDVPPHQHRDVDVVRDQRVEGGPEVRDAAAQHGGVERHVDAGHHDEGVLAARDLELGLHRPLERLAAGDGAGQGVLRAREVVVDDLDELTRVLGDPGDPVDHVGVGDPHLGRADRGHAVVRPAVGVARDQLVHGRPALEHDLQQRLELEHAGDGGQGVVLADRVAGEVGVREEQAVGLELGALCHREARHGHLGELRQVEDAVRVPVHGAAHGHLGGVLADERQDREPEGGARVGVGAVPDLAGGRAAGAALHAHALGLDALTGEGVDGARRLRQRGGGHDGGAVDGAGDLEDLAPGMASGLDRVHADPVARADGGEHSGGPARQPQGRGVAVGGLHRVLGGGREPHAVDDHAAQAGQLGRGARDVDRVVVAGDQRERGHVMGRGQRGRDPLLPRGLGRGDRLPSPVDECATRRAGLAQLGAPRAAADGEPLGERAQRGLGAVVVGDGDLDGHLDHAAQVGVAHIAGPGDDDEVRGRRRHRGVQADAVVQVHQVEQALDHGAGPAGSAGGAEGGEHGGPGGADERVRDAGRGDDVGGQAAGGHAGVVRDERGLEGEAGRGDAARDLGELGDLRAARAAAPHSGGRAQERPHGGLGVGVGDDRRGARGHVGAQGEGDDQLGRADRQPEVDRRTVGGRGEHRAGDRVTAHAVGVDLPGVEHAEPVDGADDQPAGPLDVGGVEDVGDRTAGGGDRAAAATAHGLDARQVVAQALGRGRLEPVEQLPDRLVGAGDPGDRGRAGDHADRVGVVPGVVSLPEGVRAPPPAHVAVDDGDERHGLARQRADVEELDGVRRVQRRGGQLGVAGGQRVDHLGGAFHPRRVRERRPDDAGVDGVQARLGALDHAVEALADGGVEPHRARAVADVVDQVAAQIEGAGAAGVGLRVAAVGPRARGQAELGEAAEPGGVRHGVEVAEVRLGRAVDRGDDLVPARGHGVGVAGDLVQQAAGAGGRVVDLVDVRAELAAAGGHPALRAAGGHPVVHADGVHQELLDLRARGGLEGGHRGGAHEDAVHGHGRVTVGVRPGAGEIVGGPLGRADAAAHAQHHVGAVTEHRVRGQQEIVEVLPRVVSAGAPTLDLDDHGHVRHLGGDPHHLADLGDGARLEAHVPQPGLRELLDERHRFVELGDAGGDDHAVEGDSGGAGPLHEPLASDLHLPQVRVEEEGVELRGAARLEQLGQTLGVLGEDVLGDLAAARELGPVPGVGRRGDDLRVDRGGGHAREQDRRGAGEAGERGLHVDAAVGQGDQLRLVRGPRALDHRGRSRGEEVAQSATGGCGDHADPLAAQDRPVETGQGLARSHVEEPFGAGVQGLGHLVDPVDRLDEDQAGQRGGTLGVEPAARGPVADDVDSRCHRRVVEADLHVERVEDRGEDLAAGELGLATTT